jgi:hypothetical protein
VHDPHELCQDEQLLVAEQKSSLLGRWMRSLIPVSWSVLGTQQHAPDLPGVASASIFLWLLPTLQQSPFNFKFCTFGIHRYCCGLGLVLHEFYPSWTGKFGSPVLKRCASAPCCRPAEHGPTLQHRHDTFGFIIPPDSISDRHAASHVPPSPNSISIPGPFFGKQVAR